MENKRLEFVIHEAGCMIMVAPMSLGGHAYESLMDGVFAGEGEESLREMVERGAIMPMSLYQDDGYAVRVVLGELTEQEAAEWTARVQWRLNIPCGKLLVTGALDEEEGFTAANDGDSFWLGCYVEVPPGEYKVEVYSYPPGDLTTGWGQIENFDGEGLFKPTKGIKPEKPIDYFCRTRPNEEPPRWLENDGFYENQYIQFIVRLSPLTGELPMPEFEDGDFLKWQFRKPEICPLGIPSVSLKKKDY